MARFVWKNRNLASLKRGSAVVCRLLRSRAMARSLKQPESGFTLLEVVVAFALLSLASAGIFYMGTLSTSGNTRSQDEAAAVSLAVQKLEQLKNSGFAAACSSPNPERVGPYWR